jgi:ferredoxin
MAVRINPNLIDDLEHYGAQDVSKCYQCGNCSAACPHSENPYVFPRKSMHQLQTGQEKPLRSSLDPWLCYYCGDCSTQCPRGAEPGETMMALRRWLTSQYDFTGLSRLLYRSWAAELTAILIVALLTGAGFLAFGFMHGGNIAVYDGENAFLPAHYIHIFDWTMGTTLGLLLFINAVRMWRFTVLSEGAPQVGLSLYLRYLVLLPVHFFTQERFRKCENKKPWALHLWLMLSYLTMLILIMFFLKYVQAGPEINWFAHGFGYLSAFGLVVASILHLRGRIQKDAAYHRHSHESDWMFLALLIFVSVTGVVQHILHRAGMPMAANITYVVHLMGVVPMLGLEVPFSKWSHLAYRPLAVYFAQLLAAARAEHPAAVAQAAAPAD